MVTEANGARINGWDDLRRVVRDLKPGDTLTLKGFRGDRERTWQLKAGEMPDLDRSPST